MSESSRPDLIDQVWNDHQATLSAQKMILSRSGGFLERERSSSRSMSQSEIAIAIVEQDLAYLINWYGAYQQAIQIVGDTLFSSGSQPRQSDSSGPESWLADLWQWATATARGPLVTAYVMITSTSYDQISLQYGPDGAHTRTLSFETWLLFLAQRVERASSDPSSQLSDRDRMVGALLIMLATQAGNREQMLVIWELFNIRVSDLDYVLVYLASTLVDDTLFELIRALVPTETVLFLHAEWSFLSLRGMLREGRTDQAEWLYARLAISPEQRDELDLLLDLDANDRSSWMIVPQSNQTPPAA